MPTNQLIMTVDNPKPKFRRCRYLGSCYIAEAAQCSGYMKDCALYRESNGEDVDVSEFHIAMDQLIIATRRKHEKLADKI